MKEVIKATLLITLYAVIAALVFWLLRSINQYNIISFWSGMLYQGICSTILYKSIKC